MPPARSVFRHHTWGNIPTWTILWQVDRTRLLPLPPVRPGPVPNARNGCNWASSVRPASSSGRGSEPSCPTCPCFSRRRLRPRSGSSGSWPPPTTWAPSRSRPPLGRLSDSIGRKPVIVAGVALYAVATLLFVSTTHPGWFILFRLLEGIGAAAVTPAGQALVAELSTEETRSRAYGWLTTAQFGGLVAGPMLAWPLYSLGGGEGKWAFYTIFLFGSALSALTAIALLLDRERARARPAPPRGARCRTRRSAGSSRGPCSPS